MTPCSLVYRYECIRRTFCFHLQGFVLEEPASCIFRYTKGEGNGFPNADTCLPNCMPPHSEDRKLNIQCHENVNVMAEGYCLRFIWKCSRAHTTIWEMNKVTEAFCGLPQILFIKTETAPKDRPLTSHCLPCNPHSHSRSNFLSKNFIPTAWILPLT